MRQIPALTLQTGRHPMQEAAIAPVGASLLASFSTKPRRARETRLVQRKHAADPSPHPPDRKAPHASGCNCICRSELVSRAFQPNHEELAPTGVVQCKHAADPSPHPPDRKAPHAGGCNCTCRSELVSRAFQRDREELASTGSGDKLAQFETVPRMPVCQFRPRIFGHVDQYCFTARRTTTIQVKTIIPHHHHL